MTGIDDYVEHGFPIECRGRDEEGNGVLTSAINIRIKIYKRPGSSIISTDVSDCPFNYGPHGDHCSASGQEKSLCPYAGNLPLGR